MVEASGLLDPTPGASLPQDDSVGEIAAFGDREAGQLDKANADKRGAKNLIAVCDDAQKQAAKDAQKRLKHRFLGLF